MKAVYFLLFLFLEIFSFGQNLIPNGGFEDKLNCPKTLGDFYVSQWHSTLYGRKTPDFFSQCGSVDDYSNPKNYLINMAPAKGDNYIGLVGYNPHNGYREYVTTQLNKRLVKGEVYTFSIMLSQPELSLYFISNIGVIFTNDSLNIVKMPNTLITDADINIQVDGGFLQCSETWTKYNFNYTAKGGESYLHLGCFLTDEKLLYRTYQDRKPFCSKTGYSDAYYLIDEVSLVKYVPVDTIASMQDKITSLEEKEPTKTFVFDDVKFDTGDFASAEKEFVQFNDLIDYLTKNPTLQVLVEGHTDNVGEASDNMVLSNERALFVKSYFQSKKIVNEIYSKGYGEEKPLNPNDSAENRRSNRRVVIKVF